MAAIESFAAEGGAVIGICNGFQILTEARLLPGALQKNRGLTFLCMSVELLEGDIDPLGIDVRIWLPLVTA